MLKSKHFINCHTHIFTGDHVPPYLAKTFLPWPLYLLLPLSVVVRLFRFWYGVPNTWQYTAWYGRFKRLKYKIKMSGVRNFILGALFFIIGLYLAIQVFFILYAWLSVISAPGKSINDIVVQIRERLGEFNLVLIPSSFCWQLLMVLVLFLFFKSMRNLTWWVLKMIWSFLGLLPGKHTKEMAMRYVYIGRFAFYRKQGRVFGRLRNQYPEGTGFIILPMDMEYMGAGKLKKGYRYADQMQELAEIKQKPEYRDIFYPFVFVDPRRMKDERARFFDYKTDHGKVILKDCFIRDYIEEHRFSGFKIYPALGYYPFEEELLPLWKYAADNGLPVLPHCIRGTIYYRGPKQKIWDTHPVFMQAKGNNEYEPLALMEVKNQDYTVNFTHPLNYLCLLEETLLRKLVCKAKDARIRDLFGYVNEDTPMTHNLSHLKLCFGHFGGDDEWARFLEKDRDNYSQQLVLHPDRGITFLMTEDGDPSPGKPEQLWKHADWYSIICSLMLQFENVYADLSYIIHTPDIQPLLKFTLQNQKLNKKVLWGSDFYVVRNHKSEKSIYAESLHNMTDEEFDQVARQNPREFLGNKLHGAIAI